MAGARWHRVVLGPHGGGPETERRWRAAFAGPVGFSEQFWSGGSPGAVRDAEGREHPSKVDLPAVDIAVDAPQVCTLCLNATAATRRLAVSKRFDVAARTRSLGVSGMQRRYAVERPALRFVGSAAIEVPYCSAHVVAVDRFILARRLADWLAVVVGLVLAVLFLLSAGVAGGVMMGLFGGATAWLVGRFTVRAAFARSLPLPLVSPFGRGADRSKERYLPGITLGLDQIVAEPEVGVTARVHDSEFATRLAAMNGGRVQPTSAGKGALSSRFGAGMTRAGRPTRSSGLHHDRGDGYCAHCYEPWPCAGARAA